MKRQFRTERSVRGVGAGARPHTRRLDPAEVARNRAHWFAQPVSPERTRALAKIHKQILSIANRVEISP